MTNAIWAESLEMFVYYCVLFIIKMWKKAVFPIPVYLIPFYTTYSIPFLI